MENAESDRDEEAKPAGAIPGRTEGAASGLFTKKSAVGKASCR